MSLELALILLIVVIIVSHITNVVINYYHYKADLMVVKRNQEIYIKESDAWKEKALKAQKQAEDLNLLLSMGSMKPFYDQGFVITSDGVKALPKGWQKVFDKLTTDNAGKS